MYRMKKGDTIWALEPVEPGQNNSVFFLNDPKDSIMSGRATKWTPCIEELDVELRLSDDATKMSLDGRFRKLIGPHLDGTESRATFKTLVTTCKKLALPIGAKEIHVDFVRVD